MAIPNYRTFTKAFDYTTTFGGGATKRLSKNVGSTLAKPYIDSMQNTYRELPRDRTLLDRGLDALMTPIYAVAGFARGMVDNNYEGRQVTPFEGMWEGIKAGNPFGKGYEKGEYTFSEVLDVAGWRPESTVGKIAKGVVGFGLDVFLDPTTYLSGGATALLKGTGRAGLLATHARPYAKDLAKRFGFEATDDLTKLPDQVYEAIKSNYVKQGVNPELAERYARKKYSEVSKNIEAFTGGLTRESAERIIREQNQARKILMSDADIARDAERLMKRYNKIIGLRQADEGITLSLSNAPFGEKLFKWTGIADKRVTLSSGDKLRQISEASGIAKSYAKLRQAIYGSQIGKLFSTTSPVYRLSQQSPEKVYDLMKFIDHTQGIRADKLAMEKAIQDKAKTLNTQLTPSEMKEVLEALQDKTIWSKVKQVVKFGETKEAEQMRQKIARQREETQIKLDELVKTKETIEQLVYATESKLFDAKQGLENLRSEYRRELENLINRRDLDEAQHLQVVKLLEDELESLNKRIDADGVEPKSSLFGTHNANLDEVYTSLKSLGKEFREEIKKYEEFKRAVKQLESRKKEVPNVRAGASDIERAEAKSAKLHNQAIDKAIRKLHENYPNSHMKIRHQIIDKMNKDLFGYDAIGYTTSDEALNKIFDLVAKNHSVREIELFIDKNPYMFSGSIRQLNSFLGEIFGYGSGTAYKSWNEFFDKRMRTLIEQERAGKPLSREQQRLYRQLLWANRERSILRGRLLNKLERQGVDAMLDEMRIIKNEILEREVLEDRHLWNTVAKTWRRRVGDDVEEQMRRDRFYNEDRAWSERRTGEFDDVGFEGVDAFERSDIVYDLINKAFSGRDMGEVNKAWFNLVADEVEKLLKTQFKRNYSQLTDKQKDFVMSLAFQNASKGWSRGKTIKSREAINREIARKMAIKAEEMRLNAVLERVQEGTQIRVIKDRRVYRGDVIKIERDREGALHYTIQTRKGDIVDGITPANVVEIMSGNARKTADDLIMESEVTLDYKVQRDNVVKQLNEAKEKLSQVNKNFLREKGKLIDRMTESANKFKEQIVDLEKQYDDLKYALESGDFDAIEGYQKQIEKMEDVLASDDALETYLRSVDANYVDEAIAKASTTVETVLDANMNLSDKVKNIIKTLRYEFIEMGKKEVGIEKLNAKQFEALMERYVPHILTQDGEKFFRKYKIKIDDEGVPIALEKELVEHNPALTQDLGYGQVFNPHSISRKLTRIKLGDEWIDNPTIEQINEFLSPLLQGKNAFSENIADIYLARALKHTELIYDYEYMHEMINRFGKVIDEKRGVEEGYKAVANYGMLKKHLVDVTNVRVKEFMRGQYSEFYRGFFDSIKDEVNQRLKQRMSERAKALRDENKMYGRNGVVRFTDDEVAIMRNEIEQEVIAQRGGMPKPPSMPKENFSKLYRDVYDSVVADFGLSKEMLEDLATPMVELNENQWRAIQRSNGNIVRQVNEAIVLKANQARKLQIAKDQSRFLTLYDKFTHWFKLNQTTVIPSFHMRNKLSNMFLNWLGTGRDGVSLSMQKEAWHTVKNQGDPSKVTAKFTIERPNGAVETMSWSDAYDLAIQYNVIDEGFFAADLGSDTATSGIFRDKIPAKWNPTDTKNFVLYREGARFGNKIENSDRLIHFISQLKKGATPEEAAESVKKFMFDYSDLTAFEKTWMKRIIPYYTWLRKNARLQLSQMIEQPKKYQYIGKLLSGVQGMNNEEDQIDMNLVNDFARDWVQTPFSVRNPEGRMEPVLWNPNLPFMDIGRIPNPLDPVGSLVDLFTQSNPLIKVPIEQALNYNAFFSDEIVEEGDNPLAKRADHVASQLALYNVGKGAVTKDGLDWGLHLFNSLSGIKMLSYDYDKYKHQRIEELERKLERGR